MRPPPDGSPIRRSVSNALWAYIHMLETSSAMSRKIGRNAVGHGHGALCKKTGSLRRRRRSLTSLTVIGGGDGAAGRRKEGMEHMQSKIYSLFVRYMDGTDVHS